MLQRLGAPARFEVDVTDDATADLLQAEDIGKASISVKDDPTISGELLWNGTDLTVNWIGDALIRPIDSSGYLCFYISSGKVVVTNRLGYNVTVISWRED